MVKFRAFNIIGTVLATAASQYAIRWEAPEAAVGIVLTWACVATIVLIDVPTRLGAWIARRRIARKLPRATATFRSATAECDHAYCGVECKHRGLP